jgi:hypothetical protein
MYIPFHYGIRYTSVSIRLAGQKNSMRNYFRADGLRVDGDPVVVLKKTNLPFAGATWSYYDGLVWHLSEEAMSQRLRRKPFSSPVFKLKVSRIEAEEFAQLIVERFGLSKDIRERYDKLDKSKYTPYDHGSALVEENVSFGLG